MLSIFKLSQPRWKESVLLLVKQDLPKLTRILRPDEAKVRPSSFVGLDNAKSDTDAFRGLPPSSYSSPNRDLPVSNLLITQW
jgi:hypothetical protein